jgi:cobalamin biosynthesis protein CobT
MKENAKKTIKLKNFYMSIDITITISCYTKNKNENENEYIIMTRHSAEKPRASKSARGISSKIEKCRIKKLELKLEKMRLDAKCLELQIKLNEIKHQRRRDMMESVDSDDDEEGNSDDDDEEGNSDDDEEGNSDDDEEGNSDDDDEEGNSDDDDEEGNSDDDEEGNSDDDDEENNECHQHQNNRPKRKRRSIVHYIDEQPSLSEGKFHGWTDKWDRSYNGHFSHPTGRELHEEELDDRKNSNNSKKPKSSGYVKDGFVV